MTIVDNCCLAIGIMGDTTCQTTVISAKPQTAVTGFIGTHHDITEHRTVGCRIVSHLLTTLRIIDDDTTIVGSQPVIAVIVLAYSVDVTQFQILHAARTFLIHVDTILIRADPYQAVFVQIDVTQRVIADGRLVELAVHELSHGMMSQVKHQQAFMVGSTPDTSSVVNLHIPYHQGIRHMLYLVLPEEFAQALYPALLFV